MTHTEIRTFLTGKTGYVAPFEYTGLEGLMDDFGEGWGWNLRRLKNDSGPIATVWPPGTLKQFYGRADTEIDALLAAVEAAMGTKGEGGDAT